MPGKRTSSTLDRLERIKRQGRINAALRNTDPETRRIVNPSLGERIFGPITEAIERKRIRRNPSPPDIRGATVIGTKKYQGIT